MLWVLVERTHFSFLVTGITWNPVSLRRISPVIVLLPSKARQHPVTERRYPQKGGYVTGRLPLSPGVRAYMSYKLYMDKGVNSDVSDST